LLHAYHDDLLELDNLFHAMLLPREAREASRSIGRSLLKSACDLLADARLEHFLRAARHHHQPVAFGALAAALDFPPDLAAHAYNPLRMHVSAAQRLGWIGQRQAQLVLHRLKAGVQAAIDQASSLDLDHAGAFTPAWDIASMQHERAQTRMFAS